MLNKEMKKINSEYVHLNNNNLPIIEWMTKDDLLNYLKNHYKESLNNVSKIALWGLYFSSGKIKINPILKNVNKNTRRFVIYHELLHFIQHKQNTRTIGIEHNEQFIKLEKLYKNINSALKELELLIK